MFLSYIFSLSASLLASNIVCINEMLNINTALTIKYVYNDAFRLSVARIALVSAGV